MYLFAVLTFFLLLITTGEVLYFLVHDFVHPSPIYGVWNNLRHTAGLAMLIWLVWAIVADARKSQKAKLSGESVEIGHLKRTRTGDRLVVSQIGMGFSAMVCIMAIHSSTINEFHQAKPDLIAALFCLCLAIFMMLEMFQWRIDYTWDRTRNAFFYRRNLICRLDEIAGVQLLPRVNGNVIQLTVTKGGTPSDFLLQPVFDKKWDAETLAKGIREFLGLTSPASTARPPGSANTQQRR